MSRQRIHKSRGAAMVMALVALLVVSLLAVSLTRWTLALHRQSRVFENQLQAEWLADSAVARTIAQFSEDPEFAGETWTVTPSAQATEENTDAPRGVVVIRVEPNTAEPSSRHFTIEARFPDDPLYGVLATREFNIPLSSAGDVP